MDLRPFNLFNVEPGFGLLIYGKLWDVLGVSRNEHNIPVSYRISSGFQGKDVSPETVMSEALTPWCTMVVVPASHYGRQGAPMLLSPEYFDDVSRRHAELSKIGRGGLVGQPFRSSVIRQGPIGTRSAFTNNIVFGPYNGHRFAGGGNGTVGIKVVPIYEAIRETGSGSRKLSGPLNGNDALDMVARHVPANAFENEISAGIGADRDFIAGQEVLDHLYQMGFTREELQGVASLPQPA
ncbi:MAG: hypothetical protein HYS53_02865 [Candidatus Aenigmarchaeota archaeon]|nr:hypothetical protein [Candidatus Aenigmarchaeota archaeon]